MQLEDVIKLVADHGTKRRVKQAGVVVPLTVGALLPGVVRRAVHAANEAERQLQQSSDAYSVMGKTAAYPFKPGGTIYAPATGGAADPFEPGGSNYAPATGGAAPSQLGKRIGGGAGFGTQAAMAGSMIGSRLIDQLIGTMKRPSGNSGLLGALANLSTLPAQPVEGLGAGIREGIAERVKRKLMGREYGELKDPEHIMGTKALEAFGTEAGKAGVGLLKDIANKAMEAAGHAGDEAARQAILGTLKREDSVLSQADNQTLMEAYSTMKRFAPVLSTDKNAVRSFLRQAVMSGSGPDFMSIKLLADSERAVTGEKKAAALPAALMEELPAIGRDALLGGAVGSGLGALMHPEDRARGAMAGALGGGLIGGAAGKALRRPLPSSPLPPSENPGLEYFLMRPRVHGKAVSGKSPVGYSDIVSLMEPGTEYPHADWRHVPAGVEDTLIELNNRNILND